ncbi:MAG: hypothetical protein IJT18_01840 [Oscillospiraceae bacterium]|nr:hypothetical protein [Oscillospiraceae bacterium]
MAENKRIVICPKCGAVGVASGKTVACYKCGCPSMIGTSYTKEQWNGLSKEQKNEEVRIAATHANDDLLKSLNGSLKELTEIRKWVKFLGIVVIVELVSALIVAIVALAS